MIKYVLLSSFIIMSSSVTADTLSQKEKIDQAKDLVTTVCLVGTSYSFDADVNGHIKLRSLSPDAKGSIDVNAKTAPGGVGYVQELIRENVDKAIRECMAPYVTRILDAIFEKDAPPPPPSLKSYTLCEGEFERNCPSHDSFTPCASYKNWANAKCNNNFSEQFISDTPGNRCGYHMVQITCK